ncbi:hypothetical protein ASD83_01130 [Devosia sp. Root685]|uniref:DUF1003 domain-containing protein n=1 Tax=Devosia sp. Root685 TaxID=1736587 RepID=UPI000701F1E3|nr:DUF1003 domain-containing protein [Devosia sp. Root685]KRA99165.1 hypothetical protein ASD83_01130 [Devosia sp. Root685]
MSNDKADKFTHAAETFLGKAEHALTERERIVVEKAIRRQTLARDSGATFDERLTFGQKLADGVAAFGGSWAFISGFGIFLVLWTGTNILLAGGAFDAYPFIFLNLLLSMLAAMQAPVIMMSQNRQAAKDREVSTHDYEVNLKSEIEIMALHEKLDHMRNAELRELISKQQEQIDLLTKLVEGHLKQVESK